MSIWSFGDAALVTDTVHCCWTELCQFWNSKYAQINDELAYFLKLSLTKEPIDNLTLDKNTYATFPVYVCVICITAVARLLRHINGWIDWMDFYKT